MICALQTHQVYLFTSDWLKQVMLVVVQSIVLFNPIRCFCSRPIGENRSRTLYCKVYYSSNPSSICVHAWLTRTSHVHCSAGHSTLQTHEVFLFTPDRLQFVTYTVLQSMTLFKPIRYLIGYSRSRSLQYRVLYCLNLSGIKILLIPDGVII